MLSESTPPSALLALILKEDQKQPYRRKGDKQGLIVGFSKLTQFT